MTTVPYSSPPLFAPPTNSDPGLTPAQIQQVEQARQRATKVRRAATVATVDAWLSAIFTALTALSALFSPSAFLLATALAIITFNSFRGAKRLRACDPSAGRFLALNQIALACTLIVYAVTCIWSASHTATSLPTALAAEPSIAQMYGSIDCLMWVVSLAIYGGLILGTTLAQGLAAIYYATRAKHITAYLASTPAWVIQLQRAQTGG
jgi:hypothetical protein